MSTTPHQPPAEAVRAASALRKENGRRLLAHPREEFMSREEIAAIISEQTALPQLLEVLDAAESAHFAWDLRRETHETYSVSYRAENESMALLIAACQSARRALAQQEKGETKS